MVQYYSTGDGNVFFHKDTLTPPGEYDCTCASFGPLEFTTETANGWVQPFLHSLRQKVSILYNGRPCPVSTRITPSHGGSGPPMQHMMLSVHASPQPKRHLDRFSRFCTDDRGVSIVYNGLPVSPSKLPTTRLYYYSAK